MNKLLIALTLILMLTLGTAAFSVPDGDFTDVRIINKASLSSERLAEAIAAKTILSGSMQYNFRLAARINPKDPIYWYLAAASEADPWIGKPNWNYRRLLEYSLSIDPNYLPALYLYAVKKPKLEQRLQALERIAMLDSNNAKPYYLMALEQLESIKEARGFIQDYKYQPSKMSETEWAAILDCIKKGNERSAFRVSGPRILSVRDIKALYGGKRVSHELAESYIELVYSIWLPLSPVGTPSGFCSGAWFSQLARQAAYEAEKLNKNGRSAEALDELRSITDFGKKNVTSEPHRLSSLLVGIGIYNTAAVEKKQILIQMKDQDALNTLIKENKKWTEAQNEALKLSMKHLCDRFPVNQSIYAVNEALAKKILVKLGLAQ